MEGISKWSLQISNPRMQEEFISYIRIQTRGYLKVVLPVLFLSSVVSFILYATKNHEDEEAQMVCQASYMLGVPSLIAGIFLIISLRKLAFVEFVTPIFCLGALITALVIREDMLCGQESETKLQRRYLLTLWLYCLVSQFMGATWLFHLIIRVVLLGIPHVTLIFMLKSTEFEFDGYFI